MNYIEFNHDSPSVCINKLFNNIQECRGDVAIMGGRHEIYNVDSDLMKCARALVNELEILIERNLKHD